MEKYVGYVCLLGLKKEEEKVWKIVGWQETKGLHVQFDKEYILDLKPEMMLLLKRELKVAWHNKLGFYLRLMQVLITDAYYLYLATQHLWWKNGKSTTTQKKKICTRRKGMKLDM
jgi:hypothetical protein